jgi:hypothetical protein
MYETIYNSKFFEGEWSLRQHAITAVPQSVQIIVFSIVSLLIMVVLFFRNAVKPPTQTATKISICAIT